LLKREREKENCVPMCNIWSICKCQCQALILDALVVIIYFIQQSTLSEEIVMWRFISHIT